MKLIYDTDIGWMNDDCIAALLALHSPRIDLLGITPVMGNYDLKLSLAAALRLLEFTGKEDVPVCAGFDRPLLHERSAYADQMWGEWATHPAEVELPCGLPQLAADPMHASDFIIEMVTAWPHEVTIVAVGPLTNLAVALRKAPEIASLIKSVVVMGGALQLYPDGWGNSTPLSEFNFWVDPEAARIVLRAGLPLSLLPMNVCRKTHMPRAFVDRIAASTTAATGAAQLFRDYMLPLFDAEGTQNHLVYGLYDSSALAYALEPGLFRSERLCVDVITEPGLQYGMSVGYRAGASGVGHDNTRFPVNDAPPEVTVVHDMDFDAVVSLYLNEIGA
ncbi:purine nucleosidase [Kaistia soli DSM 19436]|uniref:Purine nucleosidase n=1 Tax=Kaistia soli DSM 19436 TaxID=1122133 RepID=A0A1M5FPB5_9HYPH|nr:nucleoside hydrolase [Kaistia soli]SHF93343.1 purine nucleosidase [Kaistia soli DSM 19436]